MAVTLADALFYGARTTRDLLAAPAAPTVTVVPAAATSLTELTVHPG